MESDLSSATLKLADLTDADLRLANLSNADLEGANFSFANLSGANLKGVTIVETNFDRANLKLIKNPELSAPTLFKIFFCLIIFIMFYLVSGSIYFYVYALGHGKGSEAQLENTNIEVP